MSLTAAERILIVGSGVLRAQALNAPIPIYPTDSYEAGHSGTVVAEIRVSSLGKVSEIKILQSPDGRIADATRQAIERWTFQLFKQGGRAVEVSGRLLFSFRIDNGKAMVVDLVDIENHKHPEGS